MLGWPVPPSCKMSPLVIFRSVCFFEAENGTAGNDTMFKCTKSNKELVRAATEKTWKCLSVFVCQTLQGTFCCGPDKHKASQDGRTMIWNWEHWLGKCKRASTAVLAIAAWCNGVLVGQSRGTSRGVLSNWASHCVLFWQLWWVNRPFWLRLTHQASYLLG